MRIKLIKYFILKYNLAIELLYYKTKIQIVKRNNCKNADDITIINRLIYVIYSLFCKVNIKFGISLIVFPFNSMA